MISTNIIESNFRFVKLFILCVTAILLSISTGTTAYASEVVNNNTLTTTQSGTDDIVSADTDILNQSINTASNVSSLETVATDNEQELKLEDGYFVGEDGNVYYDESEVTVEEQVISEINEEEIADTKEDIKKDSSEVSKDTSKTSGKNIKKESTKDVQAEKKPSYSEADLRLLSCLIYSEAGNQSYEGMLAVANVVLNRADSNVYWHVDTIKEVIYDRKWSVQFSVTIKSSKTGLSPLDKALKSYDTGKYTSGNTQAQKKSMDRAIKAAKVALEGTNNIGNYLCFTNKNGASSIKKKYSDYKIIGDHIFYRTK